tara:strand:+ start:18830 stop:19954 length:1125 start_codon:yes stop_codon:yes gene_type:complete
MIRLSKSIVGNEEALAVKNVLVNDGYLGMGSEVQEFENDIAAFLNIDPECVVCVNSGTAALHLAVEHSIPKNSDVLVPSLTYLSSFQAISAAGSNPISCEVYEDSLTIDLEDAERKITSETKAIMPVHYASNPGDLEKIYDFAKKYNLRVIEDAAHAFGCSYNSKKIGSFGDLVCFSFDGIKNITSGEGGAIIAFDKKIINLLKDARLLSIEKDTNKRFKGKRSWDFDVKYQGYRYHMSNIFAAIGRVQLKRFVNEFSVKRKKLYDIYKKNLSDCPNIFFQKTNCENEIIPHIFPIRVGSGKRNAIKNILELKKIQTGIHYKPNHLLTFFGSGKTSLPITEKLYDELLTLPLHPDIKEDEVNFICNIIKKHMKK